MKAKRNSSPRRKPPHSTGSNSWNTSVIPARHNANGSNSNSSSSSSRMVVWGRLLFVASLAGAAAVLGYLGYRYTREAERAMADDQFHSLADRVLHSSHQTFGQKLHALRVMSTAIGQWNPRVEEWPFVAMPGYEELSQQLLETIAGDDMGFLPIVNTSDLTKWEDFAYRYYYETREPPFPNNTIGISPFGRGVWTTNATTGERYHDNQPYTTWNSSRPTIKTPVMHVDDHTNLIVMYNLYSNQVRGSPIDGIMDCVENKWQEDLRDCTSISQSIPNMLKWKGAIGPGAVIYQPVFPKYKPDTVVGISVSSLRFEKILENAFADTVSGVDCVLSSKQEGDIFTYGVEGGRLIEKGEGDRHEKDKDGLCRSLTPDDERYYSVFYTLCLYPTNTFYDSLSTSNPRTATIGAVLVIFLTSLIFLIYDFGVRREFHNKRALLEAKRQYMRYVSHEVRTPLNAVCMGLAVLQEELATALGKNSADELDREIDTCPTTTPHAESNLSWFKLTAEVLDNATTAADVLSDLLNYDKIKYGQMQLELSVLSFGDLVKKSVREFKLPASKKNLDFTVEFVDGNATGDVEQPSLVSSSMLSFDEKSAKHMKLVGDASRLNQVLRNLISNAIKFTPEGGSIHVHVCWRETIGSGTDEDIPTKTFELKTGASVTYPQCGEVKISVTDSGAGLSPDQLSKLFRDGVQFNVNDLQAGQGTGLGLCIAMGLVESHGGTLRAKSPGLGKGATFEMTLPLFRVPPSLDTKGSAIAGTGPEDQSNHQMNILVVDDVTSNRKLLGRLLKNRGHTYDEATDGSVAVEMITNAGDSNQVYDTILLDYEMPVMNGPTAATRIRALGYGGFIVGITGNLLPEDVQHFRSCGADAVLPKPFTMANLEDLWIDHGIIEAVP